MNDGVKILLDRMKTNPEEFVPPNDLKWKKLWEWYASFLPAEDQKAYNEGYRKVMQQHFTEMVLEELIEPKKSDLQQLREANAKAAAEQMKALRLPLDLGAKTVTLGGAGTGYSWDGVTVTKTADTPIAGVTQTV